MQTNFLIIDNQNAIPSKRPGHGKGLIEEGREEGREGTGFFSALADVTNEQQSHSGSAGESRIGWKERGNGEAESEDLKGNADGGLAKTGKTFGHSLMLDRKTGARSGNERVVRGEELLGSGLKGLPAKLKGINRGEQGLNQADHKTFMGLKKADAPKTVPASTGLGLNKGREAVGKGVISPKEILKVASLLKELGAETAQPVKTPRVSGQGLEKLTGNPEKTDAPKTVLASTGLGLNKGREAVAKGVISPKEILKVASLLKELGSESAKPVKLTGVSGQSVERLSGNPEKVDAPKTDLASTGLGLNKGREAVGKGVISPKEILKVASLLKELGAETAQPVKTPRVSGQGLEKLTGNPEKTDAPKTVLASTGLGLNKGREAVAKGVISPKEILKVASLLKELGAESAKPVKLTGVSGQSVERLSGNPEKVDAPKTVLASTGLGLNKGREAVAKGVISPKEILKVASLLKELGSESAKPVKLTGVSGQSVERLSGNPEKVDAPKTVLASTGLGLNKGREAVGKGVISPKEILKVASLLKELGAETAQPVKTPRVSGQGLEKLTGNPEKTDAQKTVPASTGLGLNKGREAVAKGVISPKEILKVASLLKELGSESAKPVKLTGVSGQSVERLSGNPEKVDAPKTVLASTGLGLNKGREAVAKGVISPKEILKVASLLKELGSESAKPVKLTGVSGQSVERLSGNPEKVDAPKTDLASTGLGLNKGREAVGKGVISPKEILKVASLLKELGAETAQPVKTPRVSGQGLEKLTGNPEKTDAPKTVLASTGLGLNKGREAVAKGVISPKEILKVASLLKELGAETAKPVKLTGVSGQSAEKLSGNPEKVNAPKTVLASTGLDLNKGKESAAKVMVNPKEILKVASLLKELGAETAKPVKLTGVSGQSAERLSGNPEKVDAPKTVLASTGLELNKGKELAAKVMVNPKEILKVASLLKELGSESAKPVKLTGVSGQSAEKLSGNPEKVDAPKTVLASTGLELNKGKESAAKVMVNPKEILKVASLLKELGSESAKPVKLTGLSGQSVEKLSGNPEKTDAPKPVLASTGLELNKGREAVTKGMINPDYEPSKMNIGLMNSRTPKVDVPPFGHGPQGRKEGQGNRIVGKGRKEAFFEVTSLKTGPGHSSREASVEGAKSGDMNGQGKKDHSSKFIGTSRAGTDARENMQRNPAAEETSSKLKTGSENTNVKTGKTEIPDEILSPKMANKTESSSNENPHLSSRNNVPPDKMTGTVSYSKEAPVSKKTVQTDTLKQIVKKATFNLESGRSEFKIDLKPESLGHLKMRISTENNQVTVKIVAETHLVKEMIESNVNKLKTNFQNQGLVVEKVEVSVGQDSKQQGMGYDTGESHGRARTGNNPGHGRGGHSGQGEKPDQKERSIREAMNEGSVDFFA